MCKVDDHIRSNFGTHIERALAGDYDHWMTSAFGCLALIVLLDQFTRNIYRNTAAAWSGDAKSLRISLHAIEKGFDQGTRTRNCYYYLFCN
jgi:uncharacterized protein (DUF924 family)